MADTALPRIFQQRGDKAPSHAFVSPLRCHKQRDDIPLVANSKIGQNSVDL
jgi:hypothetical protein